MRIFYHPRFKDSYRKLPLTIQKKAEEKETIFRKNPFDSRLKTHKLHGKLRKLWSFSVDGKYRILFEFVGKEIILLDIDDHDLYK